MKHNTPPTLSILVITYNEAKHIEDLIDNISFADEIVIVDSYSSDGTLEKLKKFPQLKVYQKKFIDFPTQRNYALSLAKSDWILFVDADERLSTPLISEIKSTIKLPTNIAGYEIPRKFFFQDKVINYSGLQTDYILRLFKNRKGVYDINKKVHERLLIDGKIGRLKNIINHFSFADKQSYKRKTEHYAEIKAEMLYANGKKADLFDKFLRPAYNFIYNYIFRLGFLDGKEGFIICKLNAYGVYQRYQILDQMHLSSPKH